MALTSLILSDLGSKRGSATISTSMGDHQERGELLHRGRQWQTNHQCSSLALIGPLFLE